MEMNIKVDIEEMYSKFSSMIDEGFDTAVLTISEPYSFGECYMKLSAISSSDHEVNFGNIECLLNDD